MALDDVLAAVKTRWDAKSLDDTVTGGLHYRRGPDLAAPYVVLSDIASTVALRTGSDAVSGNEYTSTQFQLLLVHNGGPAAARTAKRTIRAAFDWAPLTLAHGTLVYCKFASEATLPDPQNPGNPNAVLWAMTYEALMYESKTLSPA